MFGDTRGGKWEQVSCAVRCHRALHPPHAPSLQLLRALPPAPMDGERDDPALTFGLAGKHSGVSFHTHGAVFAEVRRDAGALWLRA